MSGLNFNENKIKYLNFLCIYWAFEPDSNFLGKVRIRSKY